MEENIRTSGNEHGAVNYMRVVDGDKLPEGRLLGYINTFVTNIMAHEMPKLIESQKVASPTLFEHEIEKMANTYIGAILGEKDLLSKEERELVAERVINALPLNLDHFTDVGQSILKQLTEEMKITFSTYKEQKEQGLERQKRRTQESLSDILRKFNK